MTAMIYAPFPDRKSARGVIATLLEEKLVACANILGGVESHFIWEGKLDSSEEVGVLFKTDDSLLDAAVERVGSLHPYETPAVLGWRCDAAPDVTREWLREISWGGEQ